MSRSRTWSFAAITAVAIIVGVVLRLPALQVPFAFDDHAHIAMLEGRYPVHRSPLDLFNFADGSADERRTLMRAGSLPWWSHSKIKFAMLRPLSSALIWADHAAFPRNAFAHHVHSIAWWAAMVVALAMLLRRLLPLHLAAVAIALFVLDESHTTAFTWLANRNAIVSLAFGLVGLDRHIRYRDRGHGGDGVAAFIAFTLSLLAGEYALCVYAYVLAFELFGAERLDGRARVVGLAPAAIPLIAYTAVHRALGYGTFGSGSYIDPLAEPRAWFRIAPGRFASLLADLLGTLRTEDSAALDNAALIPIGVLAITAVVLVAVLLRGSASLLPVASRKHVAWLASGAVLALIPALSSHPSGRLLVASEIGACVAMALLIVDPIERTRRMSSDSAPRFAWLRWPIAAVIAFVHLGLAPRRAHFDTRSARDLNLAARAGLRNSEIDRGAIGHSRIVALSAADAQTLLYAPMVWHLDGAALPQSWWVLSMAPGFQVVYRTAADTIEIEPAQSDLMSTPSEILFRGSSEPFHAGDVVHVDGMTVTIVRMGARGPRRVRFQFDRSLEAPSIVMYASLATGLRRLPAPPVGSASPLPPAAIPMK